MLQLTLFGTGTILGAGIYVLVGKVAGEAGMFAPVSFLVAAIIAGATAFSYAELSSRYPKSAGEAAYVMAAFNNRHLAIIIGWAIVLTGLVSASTLANGFVGYFQQFIAAPAWLVIIGTVVLLGILAAFGITASMNVAATITIIEIIGLLIIVWVAGDNLADVPARLPELIPDTQLVTWTGIIAGAFLGFYAFIGFEDMVNVAEEVTNPSRTIPRAIFIAFIFATFLYVLVSLTAVVSIPPAELTQSDAPFALIVQNHGYSTSLISLISLVSIINGALVQIIMASRVLYGLADQGNAPRWMGSINKRTRTPIKSTMLVTAMIIALALALPLVSLAKATSFIVLIVFTLVNLTLLRIKMQAAPANDHFRCPTILPVLATLLCVGLLTYSVLG